MGVALMAPVQASSMSDEFLPWLRPLLEPVTRPLMHRVRLWRHGIQYNTQVSIPVAGKPALQASLYLPDNAHALPSSVPTILVMLPYGRHQYGEALRAGVKFGAAGFAVLALDLRGYESDPTTTEPTRQVPWAGVTQDAVAVLDWITQQTWSNGRVGSFGCSALGETQFALAKANHPAHQAMLVSGAGGAMGSLKGQYGYFGLFEGGVFQLASGYGWLARRGWLKPPYVRPAYEQADDAHAVLDSLNRLPVASQVNNQENAWGFITKTPLHDPAWRSLNYIHDDHKIAIPTLTINTWADQTLSGSLALHRHIDAPEKRLILAPGDHCNHEQTPAPDGLSWQEIYNQWFDRWLWETPTQVTAKPVSHSLAPVNYRLPGDTEWRQAQQWPPQHSKAVRWRLTSATGANSRAGDGRLQVDGAAAYSQTHRFSEWLADPANPVPSAGGPVCCTSTPTLKSGAADQRIVEERQDVLVFTGDPFSSATTFAGPTKATIFLSTDAPDADLIIRLTDVSPDGQSINIQEGAQRISLLAQDKSVQPMADGMRKVQVAIPDLAYQFLPGHRLRVHVAASSFPRLARNLQTTGFNRSGTDTFVATLRLHHSREYPSSISLTMTTDSDTGR